MDRVPSLVADRQTPLKARYREDAAAAITVKHVRTVHEAAHDALHGAVDVLAPVPPTRWAFGQDAKVGGYDDLPNSGHLLCAALACCQDNIIRMIADRLGVPIAHLEVEAIGRVDCRGCLAVDPEVPVGFTAIDLLVHLEAAPGTDERLLAALRQTAERYCVTLDTLRRGVPVTLSYPTPAATAAAQ